MKPPVIINENGDVSIYRSPEEAALGLEPIDVRHGEYVAYDSEGRILQLDVVTKEKSALFRKARVIEFVEIVVGTESIVRPDELRDVLISFFRIAGNHREDLDKMALCGLIQEAVARYGYTR